MTHHNVSLVDSHTASALAQILPVLLLTLAVELRRTQRHRGIRRWRVGVFLAAFGLIETVLVLSIDGTLYPFQWFDIASAVIIFSLMTIIFALSLTDPSTGNSPSKGNGDNDDPA